MKMTPQAKKLWEMVPKEVRMKLLNNVWCTRCSEVRGIGNVDMTVDGGDLLLKGICSTCGGNVARVVENPRK
jgi:hypothetical protein